MKKSTNTLERFMMLTDSIEVQGYTITITDSTLALSYKGSRSLIKGFTTRRDAYTAANLIKRVIELENII